MSSPRKRNESKCVNYRNGCEMNECIRPPCRRKLEALLVLLFAIVLFVYISSATQSEEKDKIIQDELISPNPTEPLPPSHSQLKCFKQSIISLDGAECADIGKQILLKNGSAVDAMIAALICNGMVNMQSMGLGGGFFMLIYKRMDKTMHSINARETAPKRASNDFYKKQPDATADGPFSVAVPGEVKGYYAAYQKFGKLPWKELVQPSIKLCENGYILTNHQFKSLKFRNIDFKKDENFREWFYDENGEFKKPGTRIRPSKLCKTLNILAKNGPNDFYTGDISKMLLEDMKNMSGIITEEDFHSYEVDWNEPYKLNLKNGDILYSAPPPASGPILGFIINTLSGYNFTKQSTIGVNNTITTFHRILEVFKFAYAKRSELGDPKFVNIRKLLKEISSDDYVESIRKKIKDSETYSDPFYYGGQFFSDPSDHGTSHLTLIAPNGDAVSVTSSLNIFFGAGMTSKQTGIVWNSHMDDFSYPWKINYFGLSGSPQNKMEPKKRPLSSMSPSIILDNNGDVKLVLGAAGGSQITTSVALTLMRILWFENGIKEAIDAPRIHHQLLPMIGNYEYGILEEVIQGLKVIGHDMKRGIKSNIHGLKKDGDYVYGNADFRKGGNVVGF